MNQRTQPWGAGRGEDPEARGDAIVGGADGAVRVSRKAEAGMATGIDYPTRTFCPIIASRASCETAPSCQRMLLELPIW